MSQMKITIYGINNCTTVQKAKKWLDNKNISYTFWDYKKQGAKADKLNIWCDRFGFEKVLNKQGQIWKKASESEKSLVVDQKNAIDFMLKYPSSIKRPILEVLEISDEDGEDQKTENDKNKPKNHLQNQTNLLLGFQQGEWESAFLD